MMKTTILFLLVIHGILWEISLGITSMRVARLKYLQNSRYLPAHFRHFIANQSNILTVKACAYACHSHDYCRTANYFSIESICSLYEEATHVGRIVSALSTTVIQTQLCPDGITEETHVCYGDPTRAPIPLQTAFNSMSLVHQLPVYPAAIIMTTELMYVPVSGRQLIQVYDMQTMELVNSLSQSCNIAYCDMTFDSNSNLQNIAVQCQSMIRFLFNGSPPPSSSVWFSSPCFNEKYLIGQMVNNNRLRLWSYNRTFLYDIFGVNFNLVSTSACLVLDDTIYFSSNSAVQSVNVNGSSLSTVYGMSAYPNAITTDATGPHLFAPCNSCSSPGVFVLARNGTLLAQVNHRVMHAVAKPSKYTYRLVVANSSSLFVYEI